MSDAIQQIDDLMKSNTTNTSIEKILDKMIVDDKNLILKTDIENSKNFTLLKVFYYELKKKGLIQSATTIKNFCDWYIRVRVSNKRLSRKEVLDAISAIRNEQKNTTIGAKLFGLDGGDKK